MGLNISGGRYQSPSLSNDQTTKIRSALLQAIQDGAISIDEGSQLFSQGEAGLLAAMQMPAVQQRMNDVGRSVLGGK